MAARLTQIYYAEEQKSHCYPFSDLYFNSGLTIFFENTPIKELVMASTDEKIGVCSWKLKFKLKTNVCGPRPLTEEVINTDYDVLSFTCNTKYHKMLYAADRWHPGFIETMRKILGLIGIELPREVKTPIYQNAFMARREIYQDYVKTYLNPFMELCETHPDVRNMVTVDSNYSNLNRNSVTPESLQEKIGIPYYPLAPFLLERLFSVYVHNKKINVTWL